MIYAKKNSQAHRMLRNLLKASDFLKDFVVRVKGNDFFEDASDAKRFGYLESAGYIKHISGDSYQLTDLAKLNLLRDIVAKRQPDGEKRMVVFDIPEEMKAHREVFRNSLVDMRFRMAQRSVWVSDLPCEDLVRLLVKYHGLSDFVLLLVGEAIKL